MSTLQHESFIRAPYRGAPPRSCTNYIPLEHIPTASLTLNTGSKTITRFRYFDEIKEQTAAAWVVLATKGGCDRSLPSVLLLPGVARGWDLVPDSREEGLRFGRERHGRSFQLLGVSPGVAGLGLGAISELVHGILSFEVRTIEETGLRGDVRASMPPLTFPSLP